MSEDLIKVVLDYENSEEKIDTGLFKIIHKADKIDDYNKLIPNN
jgi:hypothetical protein